MEANREVLIGRLAVQRGLITQDELNYCLEQQTQSGGNAPLGVLLVRLGLLGPKQIAELIELQMKNLEAPSPYTPDKSYGADLLGKHALSQRLITEAQLNECVRLQAQSVRDGKPKRLGEVLVERGYLKVDQVRQLLAMQQKKVFRCPKCGAQYNVHPTTVQNAPPCKRCKGALVEVPAIATKSDLDQANADGSWYFPPEKSPVPPAVLQKKPAQKGKYVAYNRRTQLKRSGVPGPAVAAVVLFVGAIGGFVSWRASASTASSPHDASADGQPTLIPSPTPTPTAPHDTAEAPPPVAPPTPATPSTPLVAPPPSGGKGVEVPPEVPSVPSVEKPSSGSSGTPAREWDPSLEAAARPAFDRAADLVKEGEFAKAAEAVRQVSAPAGRFREYLDSRAASLSELADFHGRLLAAIQAGKKLSVKGLAEFQGVDGEVREADAKDAYVCTKDGARFGKPWAALSLASIRRLSEAALGASPRIVADTCLWGLCHSSQEDAAGLWEEAAKKGADTAPFAPYCEHELLAKREADLARALADVETLAAKGTFVQVMEAWDGVKKRFASAAGLDLAPVEAKRQAYVERAVREATEQAHTLAGAGQAEKALDLLAPMRDRLQGTPHAAALSRAWDEAAAKFVRVVAAFDTAGEVNRAIVLNSKTEWNEGGSGTHQGAGSLRWTMDARTGGFELDDIPHDMTGFACVTAWLYVEESSACQVTVRLETDREDFVESDFTLDFKGWKKVRVPLAGMRSKGRFSPSSVKTLCFWHFPETTPATLYVDDVQLEVEKLPRCLGGDEPAAAGKTPSAPSTPVAPATPQQQGPPPANPPQAASADKGPPPGFGNGKKWPRPSGDHYVNTDYGVAIIPPHGWTAVPAAKEATGEYRYAEAVKRVVSFESKNPDGDDYELKMDLSVVLSASSLDDAVDQYLKDREIDKSQVTIQPTRVGPWMAKTYEVTMDRAGHVIQQRDNGTCFYKQATVIIEAPRAAVVTFVCGDRYGRKHADAFRTTAASFLFLSAEDNAKVKSHGGASAELPAGWKQISTDHYDIQYECEEAFAQEVGRHLEAILREYAKRWPMKETLDSMSQKAAGKGARRFTVKVFKNEANFDNYAHQNGVGGAMAYFSPMQDELVCYKTTDEGKKKTFNVLYHEASHQYVHLYMGYQVDIPTWVDEGVAEVFYGGSFAENGSFSLGPNRDRITDIKDAIRQKTYVPVKDIMHYTQSQYYANSTTCYAEGWSLAYFFWWTQDKTYTGRLDRFYSVLKSAHDKDQAFKEAFGDLDMDKLQSDWKEFVLAIR